MREKNSPETIDYKETKRFFNSRAEKFNSENPYSVTMYQDNNLPLVRQRNQYETQKLIPMLKLDRNSRILDIACGIGRWADAINVDIAEYCGIDFSEKLISIANERCSRPEMSFIAGSITELDSILKINGKDKFNRILMIGILVYLNDDDVISLLEQTCEHCGDSSVICIREPIGLGDRLTLKDFYSEELHDQYNAIYRTDNEIKNILNKTLISRGFSITQEGFLFEESQLNNRKETAQYYYILER
ncbi:MAG: class I SAM-dependent methyltransferase [Oscillospiraceae bacterium]